MTAVGQGYETVVLLDKYFQHLVNNGVLKSDLELMRGFITQL
jgi:hypothetical protein